MIAPCFNFLLAKLQYLPTWNKIIGHIKSILLYALTIKNLPKGMFIELLYKVVKAEVKRLKYILSRFMGIDNL